MSTGATGPRTQRAWSLDHKSWTLFLQRLHPDSEKAGEIYETLRFRLITLFRCRGLPDPELLADETIDRTAKGVEREEIRDVLAYATGVARYVALEARRRSKLLPLDEVPELRQKESEGPEKKEGQWECLEQCTASLSKADRDLLFGWYEHEKGEKAKEKRVLALTVGIAVGTLRVRAYRVRERIRACVADCMSKKGYEVL